MPWRNKGIRVLGMHVCYEWMWGVTRCRNIMQESGGTSWRSMSVFSFPLLCYANVRRISKNKKHTCWCLKLVFFSVLYYQYFFSLFSSPFSLRTPMIPYVYQNICASPFLFLTNIFFYFHLVIFCYCFF